MSNLNVAALTQLATTAACNVVLRNTNVEKVEEKGPLLCSVLSPAVQAAGNYVYHNAIQKTSDVATPFSHSSSLNPLEEAGAATFGAYVGYKVLGMNGNTKLHDITRTWSETHRNHQTIINSVRPSSLLFAGMATVGTVVVTRLADIVKQTYSSQDSLSTEERAPMVRAEA